MMTNIFSQTESASQLRFEYMLHMLANHIHMTKLTPFYPQNLLRTVQCLLDTLANHKPHTDDRTHLFTCRSCFIHISHHSQLHTYADFIHHTSYVTSYNYHTSQQTTLCLFTPFYNGLLLRKSYLP